MSLCQCTRLPRYYHSLGLLGEAGTTRIAKEEQERLDALWEKSPLLPVVGEQETRIAFFGDKPSQFHNFCPETAFDHFGYFATYLGRYADQDDSISAAQRLQKEGAPAEDPGWQWSGNTPQHFSQCPLYSLLLQDWPKLLM